jgi:sirohydrochlorin ferrochelatase
LASPRLHRPLPDPSQLAGEDVARGAAGGGRLPPHEFPETFALLLAAHGERRTGSDNQGVAQLAARLRASSLAPAVGFGFVKGAPSIGEAVRRLAGHDLLVYPLFLSDGYFTRTLLPRQLSEAGAFAPGRTVRLLPPLGLDPALVDLVLDQARAVARARKWPEARTELVLLAHGSSNNPASRRAAEGIAKSIAGRNAFARVRPAFLEEAPFLGDAIAGWRGPALVIGLFAGEGLHGGDDVPQRVAELGRPDLAFAGNVGAFEALPDVIAAAIRRA